MGTLTLATVNPVFRGTGDLSPTHSGTAGRLALLFCGAENAASETGIATPSGWTPMSGRGGPHTAIFGRILTGGDATPTVDFQNTANHFAQIGEWTGDVPADLSTAVHVESDAFSSSATVPPVPNITITEADCLVVTAGWHSKTVTSDGSTYNDLANFTEIDEDRPNGTTVDFVWNYWQQTTATSLSGVTRAMTGTTQSTSATGLSVAIRTAAAATPTWTVEPTVQSQTSSAYTLAATPSMASTWYAVAVAKDSAAPSATQIRNGQNAAGAAALGSANKAVTGADTLTLSVGGTPPFPVHDIYSVLRAGSNDSTVADLFDEFLDPPAGKQFQVFDVPLSGTALENLVNASPAIVDGDVWVLDSATTPSGFTITPTAQGDVDIANGGDTTYQSFEIDVYDISLAAYYGAADVHINNTAPNVIGNPSELAIYAFDLNTVIDPVDLTVLAEDDDGHTILVSAVDALPGTLAVDASTTLEGNSGAVRSIFHVTMRFSDLTGEFDEGDITLIVGDVDVPNVVGQTEVQGLADLASAYLFGSVANRIQDAAPAGTILAQDPAGESQAPPNSTVNLTVSAGPGDIIPVNLRIITQNQQRRRRRVP